jgi:hypothetical protein
MLHGEWEALGLKKGDAAGIYSKVRSGILFPVEFIKDEERGNEKDHT